MPIQQTQRQQKIFDQLKEYILSKGYYDLGHNGSLDDSYDFGVQGDDRIRRKVLCFIQYVSTNAISRPKESVQVLVKQNRKNENIDKFLVYKEVFYGAGGRRVFVLPDDQESFEKAKRLIDTI